MTMSMTESTSRSHQLSVVERKRVVSHNYNCETLVAAFQRQGTSAYRIDFLGNGESQGSFQYGNYRREAEDLRAVVQFLISCAGRSNYCNYWPQQRRKCGASSYLVRRRIIEESSAYLEDLEHFVVEYLEAGSLEVESFEEYLVFCCMEDFRYLVLKSKN
ncbi:hypothetical protein Q3G72_014450 [Acer saccharum]|nr:hypothetical protein Q3G72_014450 [Acer saccharum]